MESRRIDSREAMTALAADPVFAASVALDSAPVLLWDGKGEGLLWASQAAQSFMCGLVDDRGFLPFHSPARVRLKALAAGFAPERGVRLERLRFDIGALAPPSVCACRMLTLASGERILVTAFTGTMPKAIVGSKPHQPVADVGEPEVIRKPKRRDIVRFVWQMDEAKRFIEVSNDFIDIVGKTEGALLGLRWADIEPRVREQQPGAMAAALSGDKTWSGLVVHWPMKTDASDKHRWMIPVEWSGTPKFGPDRTVIGFRGFGVCRLQEKYVLDSEAPVALDNARDESGEAHVAAQSIEIPQVEAEPSVSTREPSPNEDHHKSGLSEPERLAFREIARALRAEADKDSVRSSGGHAHKEAETDKTDKKNEEVRFENELQQSDFLPINNDEPVQSDEVPQADLGEVVAFPKPAIHPTAKQQERPPIGISEPPPHPEFPHAETPRPSPNELRIIDQWPDGVIVQQGGRIVFANRQLLDWLGYDVVDDLSGAEGVTRLFRVSPSILPAASGGDPTESHPMLTTREGEALPVDIRVSAVTWGGAPASLMLVSKRKSEEQSLVPAKNALPDVKVQPTRDVELDLRLRVGRVHELETILDTATDGVIVIDETGRILSLNRSAEALFGYEKEEVANQPLTILLAVESHIAALDYLEGLRSDGMASLLNGREIFGRVKQGGTIPLFMTMGKINDGPTPKFCAVLKDLSAFKKAETELLAAKRAAETANAQKSDLLAKISHEIRTPLNAIIGFAEVMMEERFGPVGNPRYKEYLRDMHVSGAHVISLVNDLLDLAKIEAGKLELSLTSVSLNDLVSACVTLLQPQAARSRVVVRTSFSPKLPPVVADERSMRQIVLNLLSNAIKFTDAGGQIIVSTVMTDFGEVAVRVRDTGIGMNETEIREALEPFRQLATSRKGGGTGLGLPVTKALVEANRGLLHISSAPGQGTLVEVLFPPTRVLAE